MGSKHISELNTMVNNDVAVDDYIILNDNSELSIDKTKTITFGELDKRYHNESDLQSDFNTMFLNKDTNDLSEGTANLYYTQARFDLAFSGKSTSELSEGANLYYTDDRVRSNSDVSDNTIHRHNILTLNSNATLGGLSLTDQELSHTKATELSNGYLDKNDFIIFNGKADRSEGDISESSISIVDDSTQHDITGLSFNALTVRGIEVLMTIEIDATTNLRELRKFYMIKDGTGSWSITPLHQSGDVGDVTNVDIVFSESSNILQAKYTSNAHIGFNFGKISFRAIVTSI